MLGHFRESQGLGVRGLEPLLFSMVSAGPCTLQVRLHIWCLTYLLVVTAWRRTGLTCQMSHTPGVLHSHCVLHAAVAVWEKHLCLSHRGCWCVNFTSVVQHTLRLTRCGCCVGTALVPVMPRLLCFERHSCLTHLGCCVGKALMSYTRRLLCKTTCLLHHTLCLTLRGCCVGRALVSYTPRRLCGKAACVLHAAAVVCEVTQATKRCQCKKCTGLPLQLCFLLSLRLFLAECA